MSAVAATAVQAAVRVPRAVDHLVLGQRPRDDLSRAAAGVCAGAGTTCCSWNATRPGTREHRDLPQPPFGTLRLYDSLAELRERWRGALRDADLVIVGSYVPEGIAVVELAAVQPPAGWSRFYDIDTPVTLAAAGRRELPVSDRPDPIPRLRPLSLVHRRPDAAAARAPIRRAAARRALLLRRSRRHRPQRRRREWDLGYLGTYSPDRQPTLDRLICEPARRWPEGRFAVAGPLYPADLAWPAQRRSHRARRSRPSMRCSIARQRFTLNVTRADMIRCGYSPSVRLFEAAACGVPIISDWWPGLDEFFRPGREILVARTADEVLRYLRELPEAERRRLAAAARERVLALLTPPSIAPQRSNAMSRRRAGSARRPRAVARRGGRARRRAIAAAAAAAMKLVIFGLAISSSWGNGHAALWRGLIRASAAQGHASVLRAGRALLRR